ncbi:MAG: GAF domain-containing protein [Chloroflexi bacterium]|nr:GAF domain-containing protein [Chloroflexota bacterium]
MLHALCARMGLSTQLLAAVAAGFLALFASLGFLGLQALEQSSRILLDERRISAHLAAHEIDRFLAQAFYELEKATTFAPFDPTAQDLSAEQHMLAHAYGRLGSFALGVSFLDSAGHIVLTEPIRPESVGADLSGMAHIRVALATGERTVSAPHLDLREGKPTVALTIPVKDRSGRVIALLSGLIDVLDSPLSRILRSATVQGGTAHAELVAAHGMIVAATDPEHVLRRGEHPDFYLQAFANGVSTIETVPYEEGGEVVDQHVMAFVPLTNAPWGLSLGASASETFAPVSDFRRTLVFTGLLFFSAVLSLTLSGAQILIRPVLALTQSAQRMARGDLSQRITVREGGEIGVLAASLEAMRQRLEASMSEITQLNSRLEARVQARTAELEERNRELAATAAIAAAVSASLDLEEVLQAGLHGVFQVVKADAGAIWLRQPPDGDLRLRVHTDLPPAFLSAEQRLACGDCLCGLVATTGQPLLVRDLAGNPLAVREACRHAGLTCLALVPLTSKGEVRGVFMLGAKTGNFDEHDVRLAAAVGHHLSLAVENVLLYEEIQRKEAHLRQVLERIIGVQEDERKRIARELHDETGQALIALIMTLESTAESLPPSQEPLRARLKRLERMAHTSLDEIRKIILDLRPSALDDLGLVAALRRYAEAHLGPLGVTSDVRAVGYHEGLWPETEVVLFRIGQEAINNVARHAEASAVQIEVQGAADQVELRVTDDGRGFDWKEVANAQDPLRGLGIMGMQERAALVGGSCAIISQPGRGAEVRVTIPLHREAVVYHGGHSHSGS